MKKALSVFLMLALVGSVFAAEPVADVNIAEFKGDASVQWGVNLDTGKTGFKNSASVTLKLNLLNEGSKSTTGDGVWGELVIKTKGDTFAKATNTSSLALPTMTVVVDKAQINFGPAYVGITSGDTQTGKLKMDAAVKSADSDNAVTLADVGPYGYTQGITAGYKHDMFNVAVDFRSYNKTYSVWRLSYNAPDGGALANLIDDKYYFDKQLAEKDAELIKDTYKRAGFAVSVDIIKVGDYNPLVHRYTNAYAFALEGEVKPVENLSIKAGVSYNYDNKVAMPGGSEIDVGSTLGYSASAGYKMALNDTFYLRPQVGFTGKNVLSNKDDKGEYIVAGGLLFGWGEIGIDDNAGVYFLDDDAAKKVSPGVGVVVKAPIADNAKITIAPSFFSGDIIPGLTAATYAKMDVAAYDAVKGEKFVYTVLNGVKYAIPVGAGTITPQLGTKMAGNDAAFSTFNLKAGVEVAGFVSNTTFYTVYESGNLVAKDLAGKSKPGLGTLNFGTKISF
ncbi:MAG: autotransporter [Spirochaetia bacterium]|nr:autotransporter [Spirochaetia bacterium]